MSPEQIAACVAIGPVIAGWEHNTPCYFFETVSASGEVRREVILKRASGGDRVAKGDAVFARTKLAERLRPMCVLIHDQTSFDYMVNLLQGVEQHQGGDTPRTPPHGGRLDTDAAA